MNSSSISSIILIASLIFWSACANPSDGVKFEESASAKEVVISNEHTGLINGDGMVAINSNKRKMMMNADLSVRVADVPKMTADIESITQGMEGLVVKSELLNEVSNKKDLPYSKDSLLQVSAYSTTSYMELKIPSQYVDSFLNMVALKSEFIYNRVLKLEDASLQYLTNEMLKSNTAANRDVAKARQIVNEAEEAMQVANHVEQNAKEEINRKVENMSIDDKVKYANISLAIHQPEKIDQVVIAHIGKKMSPAYGEQMKSALAMGWEGFKLIVLGIIYMWPLWIVAALILLWIKRRNKAAKAIKAPMI